MRVYIEGLLKKIRITTLFMIISLLLIMTHWIYYRINRFFSNITGQIFSSGGIFSTLVTTLNTVALCYKELTISNLYNISCILLRTHQSELERTNSQNMFLVFQEGSKLSLTYECMSYKIDSKTPYHMK